MLESKQIDPSVMQVALRKESVDRNIGPLIFSVQPRKVALRKESVDRNWRNRRNKNLLLKSLSARRAWIEIAIFCDFAAQNYESLSARRAWIEIITYELTGGATMGRSPQGERG